MYQRQKQPINGRSGRITNSNRDSSPWGVKPNQYGKVPRNYYGEPDVISPREKETDFWGSSMNSQPRFQAKPQPPPYKKSPQFGQEPNWNSQWKPRDSATSMNTGIETPMTKSGQGVTVNEDDKPPKVEFDDTVPKFDYLRGKPRDVKPLPYKEPVVDLNNRRDVVIKVDQMKDIIKKLVFHIDPSLIPKEEDPALCEEKHKCDGIIAHTLAKISGKAHGCEGQPHTHPDAQKKQELEETPGKPVQQMPDPNETDPLDETTQMDNNQNIGGDPPLKVQLTPNGDPENPNQLEPKKEEEKKDCNTYGHIASKAIGMKHGCETQEPPVKVEDKEEENNSQIPAMQKFAKAGRNDDKNATPQPDVKSPQKEPESKKPESKQPEKGPEEALAEDEKPKDILPSLMKILEDEELRELIQKIIDEDLKKDAPTDLANYVGPKPHKVTDFYDPTEQRRRAPSGMFFKVPPPKVDETGFSIRTGSKQRMNPSYYEPQLGTEDEEDEVNILKAQQEMFAQKVRAQKRIVPPFKTNRFGTRSTSVVKPSMYTQRNEEPSGLDKFRRQSRSRSGESRGPQTERPNYRNPQSYRSGSQTIYQARTPNAYKTARNPNRFQEPEVIRGPEIVMKLTNDDIDVNKSRLKTQQQNMGNKSNYANLQSLMNQTPNDNMDQMQFKKHNRMDSQDLLISDIMELRQMEIETQEHEVEKRQFVLNDPVIDELLVTQLYSIGSIQERLEMALESLEKQLKAVEQGNPYARNQNKKNESQRILALIEVIGNKLDQIDGKRNVQEIYHNAQSPQETLLMKILKITESRPKYQNVRRSNEVERILLLGCDFTELYSESSSKLQILSVFMEQNDQSQKLEDQQFRNHVNQFMLNLVDQSQIQNEIFESNIPMIAQQAKAEMQSKLANLEGYLMEDGRNRNRFSMIQPQYNVGQTPRTEVPKIKVATMIGDVGTQSESIVLVSENDSAIYDYKLIQNENGSVCFIKTPVFISLRFFKSDNDDITEKKKFISKLQISYLERRIQYIDQILRQYQTMARLSQPLLESSSSISYEFKDTCKMALLKNKRSPVMPSKTDIDIEVLSQFDVDTLLQVVTCLMQNKKLIFASTKGENTSMTMLAVRDMLLQKCGFEWPHLFATCLPVTSDYETVSQILSAPVPVMVGFSKQELGNRILSLLQGQWSQSKSESFVVDVDFGRIVTIQDFRKGLISGVAIETYGQQIAIDFPSFFEDLAQSDIFNSPHEVVDFSKEIKLILEDNLFSKSTLWQNLRNKNRKSGRNALQNVDLMRQEILEFFETTQYDQLHRGNKSQRVPMSMRAGGPQKYSDFADESETKSYGQARQDFQFVSKFLQTEMFVAYVKSL